MLKILYELITPMWTKYRTKSNNGKTGRPNGSKYGYLDNPTNRMSLWDKIQPYSGGLFVASFYHIKSNTVGAAFFLSPHPPFGAIITARP